MCKIAVQLGGLSRRGLTFAFVAIMPGICQGALMHFYNEYHWEHSLIALKERAPSLFFKGRFTLLYYVWISTIKNYLSCIGQYKKLGFLNGIYTDTVDWGCRIHWLHPCWGVRPPPNKRPGYDTKQSDGEAPVMGNVEYPFITIVPRSTLVWSGSTW